MKKLVLIIPYFGNFKNYFPLFLKSCRYNPKVDWLIITDNDLKNLPNNVKVRRTTFEAIKSEFKKALSFQFFLEMPYKLCDFRPTYGQVFQKEIEGYDYWGYCDSDLIFGDLSKFIDPLMEKGYEKIFAAGHLTLYKNTKENNLRYFKPYKGESQIERVFLSKENTGFDEAYYDRGNIHRIFLEDGATVFEEDYSANMAVCRDQFYLMKYNSVQGTFEEQPYKRTLYYWSNGKLFGLYDEQGQLRKQEFLYIHFQDRNMKYESNEIERSDHIYFVPNEFRLLREEDIPTTVESLEQMDIEPRNNHLVELRIRIFRKKLNKLKKMLFD